MASMTVTVPAFGGVMSKQPCNSVHRGVIMVKAVRVPEASNYTVKETSTQRRDLVFAAAAAAACSVAKIGMAEEEPKRGTEEAKKKYTPICVTMPTARVCHK